MLTSFQTFINVLCDSCRVFFSFDNYSVWSRLKKPLFIKEFDQSVD